MKSIQDISASAHALFDRGDPSGAFEMITPLLTESQRDADILNLAGICCFCSERKADAVMYWERALLSRPDDAEIHTNLGLTLHKMGRSSAAEVALRNGLKAAPQYARAWNILGVVLSDGDRLHEAEAAFRCALDSDPDLPEFNFNLGRVLYLLRQMSSAEACFRKIPDTSPLFADARNFLGLVLHAQDRLAEAEEAFRRALRDRPDMSEVHENLARLLYFFRRHDEAEHAARRAIELDPRNAKAHIVLGNILSANNSGNISDALDVLKKSIEIDPKSVLARSNLLFSSLFQIDSGHEIRNSCEQFYSDIEAEKLRLAVNYANDRSPTRRLSIGYLSPDFRDHCQSFYTLPLFGNHLHDEFRIICYSDAERTDEISEKIRGFADVWRDVHDLDDDALAAQIVSDQVDILVDLTMHMAGGRPLLFARKPAPVQVTWLAYPGTTGNRAIDYRFTDPWLDPVDSSDGDDRYSEKSIRLPDTFWCYAPLSTKPAVTSLPADRTGAITFGCLNSPRKLTDRTFELWAKVLNQVDDSRMLIFLHPGSAREKVSRKFEALGVEPSRLEFVGNQSRDSYLQTYDRIDIALDTFPYNGHTTSLDGFWMGVPVITIAGNTPVSRGGYSLLMNLGLPELVAQSDQQFVEIAAKLARDRPLLGKLRSELRQRMEHSPLMDGARFAKGIEGAYRKMWRDWCEAATA